MAGSRKSSSKSKRSSGSKSSSKKKRSSGKSGRSEALQQFLNQSTVEKLGQKAGCVRMGDKKIVREHCVAIADDSLQKILSTAARIAATAGRKTVMSSDIIKAIEMERGVKLAYTDESRNIVSAGRVHV
jgi:histone H3/H4